MIINCVVRLHSIWLVKWEIWQVEIYKIKSNKVFYSKHYTKWLWIILEHLEVMCLVLYMLADTRCSYKKFKTKSRTQNISWMSTRTWAPHSARRNSDPDKQNIPGGAILENKWHARYCAKEDQSVATGGQIRAGHAAHLCKDGKLHFYIKHTTLCFLCIVVEGKIVQFSNYYSQNEYNIYR